MNLAEIKISPQSKAIAKQVVIVTGVLALGIVANTAMAAGGFSVDDTGQKADTFIKGVIKWAVIIAGGVGAGVLLVKLIQAWNSQLDWIDFIKFALFYALAGSVVTVAATLYGAFS